MSAKDVTSNAEHSKKDTTVTRNEIVVMTKIPPEQKNEVPQAKPNLPRTPLKYARASEFLAAAKEPVDPIPPTLAPADDNITPHAKQRMTRSVSKQEQEAERQLLQDMQAAQIDDIDSDDFTYKGSDLQQDTPPSQHSHDSDYQPTPSFGRDENTSRKPSGDHGIPNGPPVATISNNEIAKDPNDTLEWDQTDSLVPLRDNKCTEFLTDLVMRFIATHNFKSDISRAGIISMIEGAGLDYWGVLAAISKGVTPIKYVNSKKSTYVQNEIASYVGESHHHPYSPRAT
jgi:hypothetical protein